MTNKTKIVLIYTTVALICALAIGGFATLGKLYDIKALASSPLARNVGKDAPQEFLTLQKDLTLTNQAGKQVSIFDLKDKVWVFAQFFAKCPMCAQRNYTDLMKIYEKYNDDPQFMLVCMTVDPEADSVTKLQAYAKAVGADTKNWWFLTGNKKELHSYMSDEMKFLDIRKRTNPEEIATKGKYAHDLGLAVFDQGLVMRVKRDLSFARSQNKDLIKSYEADLHQSIQYSLKSQ